MYQELRHYNEKTEESRHKLQPEIMDPERALTRLDASEAAAITLNLSMGYSHSERRNLVRLLRYHCLSAVVIATVPWRSMTAGIDAILEAVNPPATPARQIGVWTEWLQSAVTVQDIQTQQLVLTAALISLICAIISFVMTEV